MPGKMPLVFNPLHPLHPQGQSVEDYLASVQPDSLEAKGLSFRFIDEENTVALVDFLTGHPEIEYLCVEASKLGEQGAIALAELLKKNQNIKDLYLRACEMTLAGAKALAEALKVNHSITHLDLSDISFDIEAVDELVAALEENTSVIVFVLDKEIISLENERSIIKSLKRNITINETHPESNHPIKFFKPYQSSPDQTEAAAARTELRVYWRA